MTVFDLITKSGGRRFTLAFLTGCTATVLLCLGYVTPEIYRDIVLGCVAAYIVGNTYQKVKGNERDDDDGSGGEPATAHKRRAA